MRITRPLAAIAVVAASALALSACAGTTEPAANTDAPEETITWTWDRNTAGEDEEPVYESTSVEVPVDPEKIVVFDLAALDTIGSLGGEVAGAPLESVPDYLQDFLTEDAFNAGTLFEPDLIEIEAQQPDLIIIGGRSAGLYDDLSAIAPTIDMGLRGGFTETLERNATFVGELLGAEDEAATAIAEIEAGIAEARAATENAGTGLGLMIAGGELTAMAPAPEGATGSVARGGLIYDVFGVEPVLQDIAAAAHGEPVSFEFVLENDPDYLWIVDRDSATGESTQSAEAVLDNHVIAQTTASKEGQIYYLNPVPWYIVFGGIQTTNIMIEDVLQITE